MSISIMYVACLTITSLVKFPLLITEPNVMQNTFVSVYCHESDA